jgi:hypothetical protein
VERLIFRGVRERGLIGSEYRAKAGFGTLKDFGGTVGQLLKGISISSGSGKVQAFVSGSEDSQHFLAKVLRPFPQSEI